MTRRLPTALPKKVVEAEHSVADFSSHSKPKGYFHQEVRHPSGTVVKITASQRSGPFHVRKYVRFGNKSTDENSTLTTLSAAYEWARKHLPPAKNASYSDLSSKLKKEDIDTAGVPDAVPDFEMAEDGSIVPDIGVDDRLYTEDEEEIVPSDVVSSGRLYTT